MLITGGREHEKSPALAGLLRGFHSVKLKPVASCDSFSTPNQSCSAIDYGACLFDEAFPLPPACRFLNDFSACRSCAILNCPSDCLGPTSNAVAGSGKSAYSDSAFYCTANPSCGDVIELIKGEFGGLGVGEGHGFVRVRCGGVGCVCGR